MEMKGPRGWCCCGGAGWEQVRPRRGDLRTRAASVTPQARRRQALEPRRGTGRRLFSLSCLRVRGLVV